MRWHEACKECWRDRECSMQEFDEVENCDVVEEYELEQKNKKEE